MKLSEQVYTHTNKRKAAKGWMVESMKKYEEMTKNEIEEIIKKGGDRKTKLNQEVAEYLDSLNLSQRARDVIASTDIQCMAEAFYNLMTAEEVEEEIAENYPEEEE